MSSAIHLRTLGTREFRDPLPFLRRLRLLEARLASLPMDADVRALRTNRLKEWRETRTAALFCHGMSKRLGHAIYLAKGEIEDADFVASWMIGDEQQVAPVQLKEVVPEGRNGRSNLDSVLESLRKYSSPDLTVVLHFNRELPFDPGQVSAPDLQISSLWILGCTAPDGSEWGLWGDFLTEVEESRFAYPL